MITNLLSVWSTIGGVALAILILLGMITIHEFGHYCAGKLLKFRIDEFSIGFGPALFKHRSKKSGELFAVRLVPLGGYCAFHGEDGLDEDEKESEAPVSEEDPFDFAQEPEKTEPAQPPERLEGEEKPSQKREGAPYPQPKGGNFTEMKPWKRVLVLIAGAFMNYLLALVFIFALFASYGQTMVAVYRAEPTDEIPAEYCLRDLDILLEADGKNLYLTTDLARAVNGKKAGTLVPFRISRVVRTEAYTDEEGGEHVRYFREEMEVEIMLRCDAEVKNSAETDVVFRALGFAAEVSQGENGEDVTYMVASSSHKFGFFETVGRSFVYSFKIAGSIFRIIGELLTGRIGINVLGGPVSTISMTSQIASSSMRNFLEISAFIGVNLAVFNLLPIPALDGSKVVFTLIEWARGKPISRKVEAAIHAVGFILLLGFAILVDVLQFI